MCKFISLGTMHKSKNETMEWMIVKVDKSNKSARKRSTVKFANSS